MLPEWKVVGYLHHPLRQHFCFLMKLFSSQASCYDRAVRPPTSQSTIKAAVLTLKMENGFPCRPGCDTAPAQSIHMDLGVRMDGYGPPPPKKDGHPAWGGRLFLCGRELKPKRAACGQENSPGDCFPDRTQVCRRVPKREAFGSPSTQDAPAAASPRLHHSFSRHVGNYKNTPHGQPLLAMRRICL